MISHEERRRLDRLRRLKVFKASTPEGKMVRLSAGGHDHDDRFVEAYPAKGYYTYRTRSGHHGRVWIRYVIVDRRTGIVVQEGV
jgi:hypothetical protein